MVKDFFRRVKNTMARLAQSRLMLLGIITSLCFIILIHRIFDLQIVQGQYYLDNFRLQIRRTREIQGTRGNIYDRNGNLLAYNELANSIIIEGDVQGRDGLSRNEVLNGILADVIEIVEAHGDSIISGFGIILDGTGNYAFAMTNEFSRLRFIADVFGERNIDDLTPEQANSTADDIIRRLATHETFGYGLDLEKYDRAFILQMINLRYSIHLNSFTQYIPTTLAYDVSDETVAAIMENQYRLFGVSVSEYYMRRYYAANYFASIIGYTGKISQEELDLLNADGPERYSMNDIVGKAGIEQVMEEVLQGNKGSMTFYVDNRGRVTDVVDFIEPGPGNSVHLTIDRDLQIWGYHVIQEKLAGIILDRLRNVMNYDPGLERSASDIIIPIDQVYFHFIANNIIDSSRFPNASAGTAQNALYHTFGNQKGQVLTEVLAYLNNPNGIPYGELSSEMQDIMSYISITLLSTNTSILIRDNIDTNDSVHRAWTIDESINIHEYLNHAITENWIDTGVLANYVDLDRYTDASSVYEAIVSYLEGVLVNDIVFERMIYLGLIRSGGITGGQIFAAVYEQGVLPMDQESYQGLLTGTVEPFGWVRSKIQNLEITPGQLGLEPSTGSVVISEPGTGAVLASVSYPGYDNNRLANTIDADYYNALMNSLSRPFWNNATQESTAPGSTFKMVTAVAGLTEGLIDAGTHIFCEGEFKRVTPHPRCWSYPYGDGSSDVIRALDVSCNVFFYSLGFDMGISNGVYNDADSIRLLAQYAAGFGLNEPSGIEIPEVLPHVSDEIGVLSAIGQGTNNFTTSQLNRYVATIANRGDLFELTLLDRTTDATGRLINDYTPALIRSMDSVSSGTWDLVEQGMVNMVLNHRSFATPEHQISMAGKTGTAQQSNVNPDHALFVAFAPVENPEYAISVRITNGYTSTYAAEIARDIMRIQMGSADVDEVITGRAAPLGVSSHD